MKIKKAIEECLSSLQLDMAEKLIKKYERISYDTDIIQYYTVLYLYMEELSAAKRYALLGIKKLPTSGDMHYNLACVYEALKQYADAYEEYYKAMICFLISQQEVRNKELHIDDSLERIAENWSNSLQNNVDVRVGIAQLQYIKILEKMEENCFGLYELRFRSAGHKDHLIGEYYYINYTDRRYVGLYNDQMNWNRFHMDEENASRSVMDVKGEFLKVQEGTRFNYSGRERVLLPIAPQNVNTIITFEENEHEYKVINNWDKHFTYYPLNGPTRISTQDICYFGSPVVMKHAQERRKLVLNIFVDGLAETIIKGEEFAKIMPNTYKFFSKGSICESVYNTGEWTYPSIANYVTSTNTVDHMMFHNTIDVCIRDEVTTLPEYFHKKGYYTSKLCGNWRIIPSYGHARGYDQFVYQNQLGGFKVGTVVQETIEHLMTFQETDQFVWISIGDLHDVADDNFLPIAVTGQIPVSVVNDSTEGTTSVKQGYSEYKKRLFQEQANYIDFYLGMLFQYIENSYVDDEILISLFSDHGQGYLLDNDKHFLGQERSNVAFMFRGKNIPIGTAHELMSTSDYLPIMCKMADIPLNDYPIDGQVPVWFGGERERQYAYTESIHPHDPYYAAIYTKDKIIFFEGEGLCTDEGRFPLNNYNIWIEDYNGRVIDSSIEKDYYEKIILDHIASLIIYEDIDIEDTVS